MADFGLVNVDPAGTGDGFNPLMSAPLFLPGYRLLHGFGGRSYPNAMYVKLSLFTGAILDWGLVPKPHGPGSSFPYGIVVGPDV